MVTDRQIAANRANAAKSTGPKSEDGKQRSARNSIKHGAFAGVDAITSGVLGEDFDEIQALVTGVVADLAPRNTLEHTSATAIAAKAIGQIRVSRLVKPLVEGVQMTMHENQLHDDHRWEYHWAKRLLVALDIAENCDEDTDLSSVNWIVLTVELSFRTEPDPELNPTRPVLVDAAGNRREPVGEEESLLQFVHVVNERFATWDEARAFAYDLLTDHEPGAYEETRQLQLAEAQRIMSELERVVALQERADRGVARALAAHQSIRNQTVAACESGGDADTDDEPGSRKE